VEWQGRGSREGVARDGWSDWNGWARLVGMSWVGSGSRSGLEGLGPVGVVGTGGGVVGRLGQSVRIGVVWEVGVDRVGPDSRGGVAWVGAAWEVGLSWAGMGSRVGYGQVWTG
jgi:hypothetical protein